MFSKIWSWIVGEVRTVEHIISDFTNTVKQLENHAADKAIEISHAEQVKASAEQAITTAQVEIAKAQNVADKIKQIVS